MAPIIVAAPPYTGELQPLLQIAEGLVQRGHAVTVLTGSRFGARVAATGARFAPLGGLADFDDRDLAASFPEAATVQAGPEQLNLLFRIAADALPGQHAQLQELLAADPDAALVTNSTFFGPWAVALGAPGRRPRRWVAVGCNPLVLPSVDTTPLGPAPVGPDGDARAANRAVNDQLAASMEPAQRRVEAALRSLGATAPVPAVFEGIVTVSDAFAGLTVPGLEFARSDAPATLHLVGALLPRAQVFVTNGGFGATQQALAARTPVVVAGTTDDKPFVAARVAAAGVGRDLGTATPTPDQVREAVLALMADDGVRERVGHLADDYAGHDALATIEHLALGEDPVR